MRSGYFRGIFFSNISSQKPTTMNISSMLAVIILLGFIKIIHSHKDELLEGHYGDSFFITYTLVFMAFASLFLYTLLRMIPEMDVCESIGVALLVGLLIGAAIHLPETSNDETFLEWLWEKFPKSRPQILSHMMIVLSGPFIGIFAVQSESIFGFYWFYGIILIACGVNAKK